MTHTFSLFSHGEMRRMPARPFPFELAMSGFIMDNPEVLFLTEQLGTPMIIRSYAQSHPADTFEQLQEVFSDALGKRGKKLHVISNRPNDLLDSKNYFVSDVVACKSGKDCFVVSRQWGVGNIAPLIEQARKLGMRITEL